ncbi:ATPase family AAA domain containing protein [Rhypophila decipiens]
MCSVAVLDMPEDISPPGQAPRQPLHPFFAPNRVNSPLVNKTPGKKETESTDVTPQGLSGSSSSGTVKQDDLEQSSGRQPKRRKVNSDENVGEEGKKKRGRPRKVSQADNVNSSPWALGTGSKSSEKGVVPGADKLQCIDANVPIILDDTVEEEDIQAAKIKTVTGPCPDMPSKADQTTSNPLILSLNGDTDIPPKPKKMLIFNPKTGTIGSPPKPKQAKTAESKRKDDGKGSPRNGQPVTRIVKVTYGSDSESRLRIGEIIDALLNNEPKAPPSIATELDIPPSKVDPPPEVAKAMVPKPKHPKTTHPFFLGKAKKTEVPEEEPEPKKVDKPTVSKRPTLFTATPCSPKKPRAEVPPMRMPQFGSKTLGLKFPGAKLPAWPWKDMVHVCGEEDKPMDVGDILLPFSSRKAKGNSVKVSDLESVVGVLIRELQLPVLAETVRNINTDDFVPPPAELRLPQKHFESGTKLQTRIISELRTFQPSLLHTKKGRRSKGAVDESDTGLQPPPQLVQLFNTIRSGLSAFDRLTCETVNWTQKYAPSSAVEVLQPGNEAFLLREWLQALTVQSVDTGSTEKENPKSSRGKSADLGNKKRRKKLDGFIVSSGDEEYELEELSDVEPDWTVNGGGSTGRRTIVRSGNLSKMRDGVKIANTLIISGPHGCGKTAAVYAVAKELDFEVFELNPGSRRSGKDILEKIGDMTRNHHVQQHRPVNRADEGEAVTTDDEVAKDLKSGKQATMNAFFKTKTVKAKPKDTTKSTKQVSPKEPKKMLKKESPKNQRQSLILLEEVDILYAEDKQFWATVMELVGQSKRPFIMTCNDETLLPVQSLRLHGIFRFSPPPRELSIDRLLLIAANEGHALSRQAVETLYESRSQDLRAATTDLQYWCQIGVGDCRGGFGWFYPRFPKGADLDENKEVIRVVSEGTYHAGMSWLGRDSIVDPKASPRTVEEELLQQTWESWGLDMGHWQDSTGLSSCATHLSPALAAREERLSCLESFESLSEALSVADVCSCRSFATFTEELLDTTLPEMSEKALEDHILGLSLLDTASVIQYGSLLTSLPSTIKSLAKSCLRGKTESITNQREEQLGPLDEAKVISYLKSSFRSPPPGAPQISRIDFAFAFDPISEPDSSPTQPASYLDPSVFDRNFEPIILDVAPYVRSIVAYDSHLQKQRLKLSSLVSQGGKAGQGAKRMRTTRAALSALEGGSRSTTRGEKWFKADINPYYVMRTAGHGWDGSREQEEEEPMTSAPRSRMTSSTESSPVKAVKKGTGRRGRPRKVVVEEESADELGDVAEI